MFISPSGKWLVVLGQQRQKCVTCVCVRTWVAARLLMGAHLLCSLRNASGLTAADLAQAQGFQDCAQLLSNMQNHLNEFCPNGAPNGLRPQIQAPSLFNGAPNRKRSLDCMESNHIKKARTDGRSLHFRVFTLMQFIMIDEAWIYVYSRDVFAIWTKIPTQLHTVCVCTKLLEPAVKKRIKSQDG